MIGAHFLALACSPREDPNQMALPKQDEQVEENEQTALAGCEFNSTLSSSNSLGDDLIYKLYSGF